MGEYLETTIDKFVFKVASDRLYSRDGVWLLEEDGRVRLGIIDYQQQLNGDLAFVYAKPKGTDLAAGDEFVEVETIMATVSFHSPIAGKILEVNARLDLSPEVVNQEPYGSGWLTVIEPANWTADRAGLLNAAAYLAAIADQAEREMNR